MSEQERDDRVLTVADARTGKNIAFEGVAIELVEINVMKNPFGSDIYTVGYFIRDNRVAPPFIGNVACLWVERTTNLIKEFRKIREDYEKTKHQLWTMRK